MKIAIVCPYNLELPGGVQEHVLAEAAELRRRKHEVLIVTPRPRRRKTGADKGIHYIGQMARIRTPSSTSADVSGTAYTSDIEDFFEEFKPDIVHIHEPVVPFMARQVLAEANQVGCPVVGTYHAARPENVMGRSFVSSFMPYVRGIAKQLTRITVVSQAATMLLQDEEVEPKIIPNGVDLKKYKPVATKRNSDNVLFVGRLEKRKGVYELLDAFHELKKLNANATLDIVGNGPLWQKLHQKVEDLDLQDVTFHGFVSQEKKRQLMSRCGVLTSPALYGESFGIVLVEAMAMGTPIVAGDNPGYATVLTDRGSISLVDPLDSEVFAARLNLMMQDKQLANLWLSWAKKSVKQYSWPVVIDKYEELFKKLA